MHINLESTDKNSIQAYNNHQVIINNETYQQSVIVSAQEIISDWPIHQITELNEEYLKPLIHSHPKVIILGHQDLQHFVPFPILQKLTKQRVGIESMSIGAACRTFNILLSEQREAVLGIIFQAI